MSTSRLVIGAGGTGRTHQLRQWVDSLVESTGSRAVWLTGSPLRFVAAAEVTAALTPPAAGEPPAIVVADDLQWFEPDALGALTSAVGSVTVVASRRPADGSEPDPTALELLVELLTRTEPARRCGLLDLDNFGPAVSALRAAQRERDGGAGGAGGVGGRALATAEVAAIHHLTGGSISLAADIVTTGWDPMATSLSPELVDAVTTRLRRAGSGVVDLVRLWAVADPQAEDGRTLALAALAGAETGAGAEFRERALRAAGLVHDGRLLPLVAMAAAADLTASQEAAIHDQLAAVHGLRNPMAAARHLLVGAGRIGDAPRILAAAALHTARTDPGRVPALVDRAEALGLHRGEAALLRALSAYHLGSPAALAELAAAGSALDAATDDRLGLLGFGLDLRDLRFGSAATRPLGGPLGPPLADLARALTGAPPAPGLVPAAAADDTPDGAAGPGPDGAGRGPERSTPLASLVAETAAALRNLSDGRPGDALAGLVRAADDLDRLDTTAPLGFTPHGLGALAALLTGDAAAAEHLCNQAIDHRSGGQGERLFHEIVRAYGRMLGGDYRAALHLLRRYRPPAHRSAGSVSEPERTEPERTEPEGTEPDGTEREISGPGPETRAQVNQRDRLGLAALEAAVARRSGDTARLRSSWQEAEQALLRPSASWLLVDLFTELLCAGARVGGRRRIEPIARELLDQSMALAPSGPGPTAGWWLWLQVGVALDEVAMVHEAADQLAALSPTDDRGQARVAAAAVWASVVGGTVGGSGTVAVVAVAERLSAVGDGWEASRLLGQVALDEEDPRVARRLLELARTSASEPVDDAGDDALVGLGLSEREAEVALMVVDGKTHKEIGGQLFISPKTVEHHVARIRQKLGATSRAELVAMIREASGSRPA